MNGFTKLLLVFTALVLVANVALSFFAPAPAAKVTVDVPSCPASAPAQNFYPTPTGSLPAAQLLTRP